MKIETTRFGEIEVDENKILNFIEPVIGYEYSKYTIVEQEDNELFQWLQCIEDPELAFPISIPAYFGIDYSFEIDDITAEKLKVETAEDITIWNIVTIPEGKPKEATINLLGPIIINNHNNNALQYILTNSSYPSRHLLFAQPVESND